MGSLKRSTALLNDVTPPPLHLRGTCIFVRSTIHGERPQICVFRKQNLGTTGSLDCCSCCELLSSNTPTISGDSTSYHMMQFFVV